MTLADNLIGLGFNSLDLHYDGSIQSINLNIGDRTLMISVDETTTAEEILELASNWLTDYNNRNQK